MTTSIVWFRLDLRLNDNPALLSALRAGDYVIPVFIWSPEEEGRHPPGAASRWWLHQSLARLNENLQKRGNRLIIARGPALNTLLELVKKSGADKIFWNRRYDNPLATAHDDEIATQLTAAGLTVQTYNASLLLEPKQIRNKQGHAYQVFSAFWNNAKIEPSFIETLTKTVQIPFPTREIRSLPLDSLQLEPQANWAAGIKASWKPGETGAQAQLQHFINESLSNYAVARDRPDQNGVSRLSPHLHFGEISVRQVWQALCELKLDAEANLSRQTYLKELGWREFAHHVLHNFPHTSEQPLQTQFAKFPWSVNADLLKCWQNGQTGYPIVDAGMRQLWQTGWMHNRVRMIAASFLTKDLLIPWQQGADWFWQTLVDADLANNSLGWQWAAGCGADAQPFFRIFNPLLQGQKFDPEGLYVHQWLPELAQLPNKWIHQPYNAPAQVLQDADVKLGHNYPYPIVDHSAARQRALAALSHMRQISEGKHSG